MTTHEKSSDPCFKTRMGIVDACMVNGVFGDPLLHLHFRHCRRSLLFDLGNEAGQLSARTAHDVSDVFISHAHLDHIGGFLWLLRSRIGEFPACRLYGPPGLARHIEGFLQGILWDRVAERGPRFEVTELHEDRVLCYFLQAGRCGIQFLSESTVVDGLLLDEKKFKVRAVTLDHQGTPVLAFALELNEQINIRKDRLVQQDLTPGPWLGELKQALLKQQYTDLIQTPNGRERSVAELGTELTLCSPGKKLVYATDFGDTQDNRQRLLPLIHSAHSFFCEATFSVADASQATRHGHLTTQSCGEIAAVDRVSRLFPFHFSRRYADKTQQMYDEIIAIYNKVIIPRSVSLHETQ